MKIENYFLALVSAILGGFLFFQFPPMGIAYLIFIMIMLGFFMESSINQLQEATK